MCDSKSINYSIPKNSIINLRFSILSFKFYYACLRINDALSTASLNAPFILSLCSNSKV
ncbi:hypothetical protein [Campylobacter fetus]|uniref:hypothetical protein n=1 Tax=Campylobacter fetus TaxID=196 RepID=UPI000B14434B|nr:hypothetical protein [Campylobacter fetus]